MIDIDGPVGLRNRTHNVTNNARDQAKIAKLLGTISEAQGGKSEAWAVLPPLLGPDRLCTKQLADAIWDFQVFWKAKGVLHVVDGVVDPRGSSLRKMNELAGRSAPVTPPTPTVAFVCGPDVTNQIISTWTRIQADFRSWTTRQKIQACNTILIPFKQPDDPDDSGIPTDLDELKRKIQLYSDIDGWDTLPLYQGASRWLRSPPVFDRARNGPCATPSSKKPDADDFDPAHEDPETCSNTVQVAGQCWLNGTVNYGTFGVMVRLCSDFAASDWSLRMNPTIRAVYSLTWATTLIRAYKRFGQNPEGAVLPVAWTQATYNSGPSGRPTIPGNRPKCQCSCGCNGSVTIWDYIWKPIKAGGRPTR